MRCGGDNGGTRSSGTLAEGERACGSWCSWDQALEREGAEPQSSVSPGANGREVVVINHAGIEVKVFNANSWRVPRQLLLALVWVESKLLSLLEEACVKMPGKAATGAD